ncbi:hypothetical protein KM043_002294 [Ampulex compressa]|nr:hypothetical protein KM043_002294 [Ampulex compressa]
MEGQRRFALENRGRFPPLLIVPPNPAGTHPFANPSILLAETRNAFREAARRRSVFAEKDEEAEEARAKRISIPIVPGFPYSLPTSLHDASAPSSYVRKIVQDAPPRILDSRVTDRRDSRRTTRTHGRAQPRALTGSSFGATLSSQARPGSASARFEAEVVEPRQERTVRPVRWLAYLGGGGSEGQGGGAGSLTFQPDARATCDQTRNNVHT